MDRPSRLLTFQACLAAIWSDGQMSAEEHRYLSHLMESICSGGTAQPRLKRQRRGLPRSAAFYVPPDPRMECWQSPHSMPEGLDDYVEFFSKNQEEPQLMREMVLKGVNDELLIPRIRALPETERVYAS